MNRNHMHLANGLPGNKGVISGMRSSCEIVIEINMVKAMQGEHKIPFFVSENNVVLCEGLPDTGALPPEYFRYVLDFKTKKYLKQTPLDYICVYDFECTCTDDKDAPLNS